MIKSYSTFIVLVSTLISTDFITKHGNRFAKLSDFTSSKTALHIAQRAIEKCLSKVHDELSRKDKTSNFSIRKSLQIQEQDMLVLSKEVSFFG